jgi:FkbM family methyltransferase
MSLWRRENRYGTLRHDLSPAKDFVDFHLTRFPRLYLQVERVRSWVNWDKRVYLSFVRKGDIVLDVGANIGAHAVFLSHLVRGAGRVLAFEPLQPNVKTLQETIRARARFSNITVYNLAVSNPREDEEVTSIKVPGADFTQASLRRQDAGSWVSSGAVTEHSVRLTSLDRHRDVQSLPHLDFIKIDVEGAELDVLEGATSTIERNGPLIYCELYEKWARSFGYTPADLFAFVSAHGYSRARVISRERVHALDTSSVPPRELFEVSADVLFLAEKHRRQLREFDRRYGVAAISR